MFSWPQLPSVSLPAAIQRRFLSFVLKRSLGHLVKPGQLDPAQIDAQIGSGFVQVNDVQLDHDAINKHLSELPVLLRLQDGSIGKISVRIPWPNLLSAPFALSLTSVCLTFVVIPEVKKAAHVVHATDDIAESVVSVAESFIHDELSERDNQSLRESLHLEPHPKHQPPGSMDPFLSTEDLDAEHHGYDYEGEDEDDAAPSTQGVSLLATLVERLLARFEFDASDITLRFVLPQKAEFVVRLGQIIYSAANTPEHTAAPAEKVDDGELRTLRASDFTVSIRDLTPPTSPPSTPRQRSASPFTSSSSDGDDDAMMMMMSQSLASLPRAPSPGSVSPGSSMYQSATSSVRHPSPEPPPAVEDREPMEDMILSLGTGSEPLLLMLVTPPIIVPEVQVGSGQSHTNAKPKFQLGSTEKIRLTLTVGPVAIALNPVHVRSMQYLTSALAMASSTDPAPTPLQAPSTNPFDFAFRVKSITILLLQLSTPPLSFQSPNPNPLQQFFLARPLPSPSPRIPHLRIQLETIDFLRSPLPASPKTSRRTSLRDTTPASSPGSSQRRIKASLDEISAFAFFSRTHETGEGWVASPVLLSDPNLSFQYEVDNSRFPVFDVVDWAKGGTTKLNQWRVRPSHVKRASSSGVPSTTTGPRTSHLPVLRARMDPGTVEQGAVCGIDVIPIHVFIDVDLMDGALRFVSAATPVVTFTGRERAEGHGNEVEDTPPATPRAKGTAPWDEDERLRERKRLETLVIDDFSATNVNPSAVSIPGTNFVLRLALLRVQVRAPPPAAWPSGPRSGALVLDVHNLQIMQQEKEPSRQRATRFDAPVSQAGPKVLGLVEFRMLFAANTLPGGTTAATFLSILTQQLPQSENAHSAFGASPPAHGSASSSMSLPYFCLRSNPVLPNRPSTTTSPGATSFFSLDAQLPSLYATVSKSTFDALTFLADDIVQRLLGDGEHATASDTSGRSRDPSLIGSRYFAQRTASTGSSEGGGEGRKSEIVVKVCVGEALITLLVPQSGVTKHARPLEITFSDVDFLAEIKPEGKDETVVTLGMMDLGVSNTSVAGDKVVILGLTIPRLSIQSSKPFLKLRFISVMDSDTGAKESRLKITLSGFTYLFTPEYDWIADLGPFVKTPEGAFESVVPSERTKVVLKVTDGSIRVLAPKNSGALVAYIGELDFSTDLIGDSPETFLTTVVPSARFMFIDDAATSPTQKDSHTILHNGAEVWKDAGYALLAEVGDVGVRLRLQSHPSVNTQVHIDGAKLKLHICADTLPAVGVFANDLGTIFHDPNENPSPPRKPTATTLNPHPREKRDVFASVDENAFRRAPDLGPAPDMVRDDLPTNLDYLDASFGAAAGLREIRDDDLFDFEPNEDGSGRNTPTPSPGLGGVIANFGGETIRMLDPKGIRVVEGHYENIPPEAVDLTFGSGETKLNLRIRNCDLTVSLYDGYDWVRTRKAIEDEVRAIRRRLFKIRQLLASGQVPDDSIEETSAILFNSVYIGLPQDPEELEPGALIAAIDEELNEDGETETGSQSSWQSFKQRPPHSVPRSMRVRGKKLTRSRGSQIDFCLAGVHAEVDQFNPGGPLMSKVLVTVKDLEILDHIRTSTWKKFLTELRTDFRGNVRETASDMVRVELRIVHPVPELPTEEGRLRAKILPIKLHVDQDALDFMKKFFSFQTPDMPAPQTSPENDLYFQHVEVFPVDLKLDYKPKRVDYRALREGRTIELMNFFHFDGAEITLRHITLSGITGWPRLFDTLNDLWTPDVKANQLADIISGVSPIRSLVNVGSGVADLVLLPIAQYKKDKRVVRGVQKGTTSFVKSTAMEAIKLGARLATGTQVILEQAETVLGGQGQFRDTVTAEALQAPVLISSGSSDEEHEDAELISRYADQPLDVREGMQTAYKSLAKNFNSAAQTILAVPMEVYERSGNEGPVRAVVRAVPIAVLKPMIGASEAVSKTLFGLRNTMDPEVRHENEAKYKQR